MGREDSGAGIVQTGNLYALNFAGNDSLSCRVKLGGMFANIPNRSVGISTAGKYYSKSGTTAGFTGKIGEGAPAGKLYIGRNSGGWASASY